MMLLNRKQSAGLFVLLLFGLLRVEAQTSAAKIDVPKLIRSAQLNGESMSKRVFDYSWRSKTLVQEFKHKRVLKKVDQDHEVYPSRGVTFVVQKLVKENGLPLPPKRAEKEQKRVETSLGTSDFLCFASFFSPRIERKEGRDTVVLLFRPRDGSISLAKEKTPFAKLVGVIWIDLKDRIVTHIEAWPVENAQEVTVESLPSGPPPIVFDDMRLADGTWVRRTLYIDTRSDPKAFNGLNLECKQEFSSYQRYFTEFKNYKIEEPKSPTTPESPSGSPP
jgi:hypothetical protein